MGCRGARAVIAYPSPYKQVWDNTDLGGPWLNLMRNSLNAQVWSFKHPDFLVVSATHGSAHLALFDDAIWEKYQLTKLAGEKFKSNTWSKEAPAARPIQRISRIPRVSFRRRIIRSRC